ncbi:hypothetical protein [Streptosporangium sandarakinum]|uniref:Phage head morphogenesis domain-containing protein n=1 Tax=Streptosporangium sandarakinum TaxID=1260955 RepID=A0A852VAW9_9ACTN|nr:hypothetical protein [Streptosporangium sandarakinum]NYF44698.1 hypothetical protein [Streptosporangium sandarakinum]
MATRITPGLTRQITALVARRVDQVADDVAQAARDNAPAAKTWVTDADERVRPSHAEAHGQLIPGNVDFRLSAMEYVRKGLGPDGKAVNRAGGWKIIPGRWDVADRPRDARLPTHQAANCRCQAVDLPGAVAAGIRSTPARPAGTTITATVSASFTRVAESEHAERGGGWLASAAQQAAAKHHARRR